MPHFSWPNQLTMRVVLNIRRVSIKDLAIHIEGIAVFQAHTHAHVHLLKYYYFGMMCIDRLIL